MDGLQICRELRKTRQPALYLYLLLTATFQKEDVIPAWIRRR